jgi:hypothetical protein
MKNAIKVPLIQKANVPSVYLFLSQYSLFCPIKPHVSAPSGALYST